MFNRIAAFAAALSIVGGALMAFNASAQQTASGAASKQVRVVQLERVVVTAKRLNADLH
jgi:hypothetical protein